MMHTITCKWSSFEECESRLIESVESAGMRIFAVIDHSKNAEDVGLNLSKTKLYIFGNPSAGTLLMQRRREIGYDLPLRVLLWEEDGKVNISYKLPSEIAREYGLTNLDILNKMDTTLQKTIENVTH
jgi:Uncharacterized conserved protein